MKLLRKILFVLALGLTVTFVPGLDCDNDNSDCEFFCDSDD
jgi:hypothetical protein